ncbi:MAG: glycosyltransferase family 2 protein [Planctomycetes bacterium]|nr:glycosyltransferase family 2 protein [Planctomycetota bacterium]
MTFLDSDDEYLPTKLARQVELFQRAPELGLVYCDSAYVDLEGTRHESVFDEKTRLARTVPYEGMASCLCECRGSLFDWLIREYFVSTISGMVRRDVLGSDIRFPIDRRTPRSGSSIYELPGRRLPDSSTSRSACTKSR